MTWLWSTAEDLLWGGLALAVVWGTAAMGWRLVGELLRPVRHPVDLDGLDVVRRDPGELVGVRHPPYDWEAER